LLPPIYLVFTVTYLYLIPDQASRVYSLATLLYLQIVISNVIAHDKYILYFYTGGTAVAQWLRCCATNRKVAGSIPAGVIGIFH